MRPGTTQPERSEGLWAQVAVAQPRGRTQWRIPLRRARPSKDGVNAGRVRGYGGISLNLDGPAEGSVPNCEVPAA